jgi:hypothetical protein
LFGPLFGLSLITAPTGRLVATAARSVFTASPGLVFATAARLVLLSITRPVTALILGPAIATRPLGFTTASFGRLPLTPATATAAPATAGSLLATDRAYTGLSLAEDAQDAGPGLFDDLDLDFVAARAEHQQRFGNGVFDGGASALHLFLFFVVLH